MVKNMLYNIFFQNNYDFLTLYIMWAHFKDRDPEVSTIDKFGSFLSVKR